MLAKLYVVKYDMHDALRNEGTLCNKNQERKVIFSNVRPAYHFTSEADHAEMLSYPNEAMSNDKNRSQQTDK